jgi:2-dehydro-3-deoxyphosphogluconate aldolase/(4S)-4-hydroxy-2-oxoglutarate aldolase
LVKDEQLERLLSSMECVMVQGIFDIKVIGILRGVERGFFSEIAEAAFASGLQALEVTMNTDNVLAMIEENRGKVPKGAFLGVGTVRTLVEAKAAISAGAMFLVTPNVDRDVIQYAVGQEVPVVAGALTPTEVFAAWQAGASMVKVFPCGALGGANYIKSLCGPFDQVPLVAVGGVTMENVGDYFKVGAQAVGVSTALFGKDALAEKNIKKLTKNVKNFIGSVPQ